jgi:ATP-dependent DNA helicase
LLLEAAEGKRRLEKLVIKKGGVQMGQRGSSDTPSRKLRGDGSSIPSPAGSHEADLLDQVAGSKGDISEDQLAELRMLLERADGEEYDVDSKSNKVALSKKDMAILMDRSDEAYIRAEKGIDAKGTAFKSVEAGDAKGSRLLQGLDN